MTDFLSSIWWLLVALGLLITFHEFGHFWVARRLGVRVLRFSIGFGHALWTRTGRDGTQYQVAAVPLGGYVKMLDEREEAVPAEQLGQAFNRKPVGHRVAIVAAGPLFNLVFAVAAFWVMFMVGIPESRPVVGAVSGIAAEAGVRPEDEIIALDGERTRTWSHATLALVTHALDRDRVAVTLEDKDGRQRDVQLDLGRLDDAFSEDRTLEFIGLEHWRAVVPAVVGEVTAGSPAEAGGMRSGDHITAIGGETVEDWGWVSFLLQKHGVAGQPLTVEVNRDGEALSLQISPREERSGALSGRLVLGISNQGLDDATRAALARAYLVLRHGPIDALGAAFAETWRLASSTVGILGRMLTGSASVKNLSGPISIAQFASDSANAGLSYFLFFLGLISLSLGILNLLPIPVLDGGHLLYYLIEWVKGSPVSERAQITGQYIGLAALFGLMSLAMINDILRLVG